VTVSFTASARADLDDILAHTRRHYPLQLPDLEERFQRVIARIEWRPQSAPAVKSRRGVRVVPLIRYPFKIFFREIPDGVEILQIYHTARNVS
jgi:plasmid stabilization system protein ParE